MSARHCDFRHPETLHRCGALAVGHIGQLALCFQCLAYLTGYPPDDPRLREPFLIQLHNDGTPQSMTEWRLF